MNRTIIFSSFLCLGLLGCSTQPTHDEPYIVKYQEEVDKVHVKDHSIVKREESRGGAALRSEENENVLYSTHYEGVEVIPPAPKLVSKPKEEKQTPVVKSKPQKPRGKDVSIYAK